MGTRNTSRKELRLRVKVASGTKLDRLCLKWIQRHNTTDKIEMTFFKPKRVN